MTSLRDANRQWTCSSARHPAATVASK